MRGGADDVKKRRRNEPNYLLLETKCLTASEKLQQCTVKEHDFQLERQPSQRKASLMAELRKRKFRQIN